MESRLLLVAVPYMIGPTANPNTKSEIPNVKTSLLQLNSAISSSALPEYALESMETNRAQTATIMTMSQRVGDR